MLLDTMNYKEMSRYLEPVRDKITQYSYSISKRATRKAKKNVWFMLDTRHLEYQNDHFYFITRTMKYKKGSDEGLDVVCLPYCIVTRNNGSRYVLQFELGNAKILRTYEIHLFQRYRERFLKDETLDLLATIHLFFRNNCVPSIITGDDIGYASIINDGVVLSNEKYNFTDAITVQKYKTFITQEMLFDDQGSWSRDGICKEQLDYILKLFHDGGPDYVQKAHYVLNISVNSLHKS